MTGGPHRQYFRLQIQATIKKNTGARKSSKPKQFSSTDHLSLEAIAGFVDNELSPSAMHRARIHLVHCPECRAEIAAQCSAASALQSSDVSGLQAPAGLIDRLKGLTDSCPEGPSAEESSFQKPASIIDAMDLFYHAVKRATRNQDEPPSGTK